MFDDDMIREINEMYWAEEAEYEAGVHPTQVLERIEERLCLDGVKYEKVTFLNWNVDGIRVEVSLDDNVYGIFDYSENKFE